MPDSTTLKRLQQRAFREFQQDGLTEIATGVLLLIASVAVLHPTALVFFGFAVFLPWVLRAARRRFTHPRVGYAALIEDAPGRQLRGIGWVTLVVFLLWVAGLLIWGRLDEPAGWQQTAPAVFGFLLACGMLFLAARSGMMRYRLLALLAALSGIAFSLVPFEHPYAGVSYWLLTLSIIFFLVGVVLFVRFVSRVPVSADGATHGVR